MQTSLVTLPLNVLVVHAPERLEQNAAAVYLASLAHGSRRTMRESLNIIAAMLTNGNADALNFDWSQLRFAHTQAIRSRLAEQYSAASANKMLSALRGCLKACWRLGQMNADNYSRAVDLDAVRGETLPKGRALTSGEIAALFQVCGNDVSAAGARDVAIIALLRVGGLRRAEICELELADYDAQTGALVVRGKRNKERTAYVTNGAKDALADWLRVRGNDAGAMFCPILKGGCVVIRRMFPEAIFNMLAKRAAEARVKGLSPHDFRRTFVSDLLDAGADIVTVQKLAGHSNPATTARYDRRGEQAKRKAVEMLHIPYRGRMIEDCTNVR